MPAFTAADTIRILVATDSHVGYEERDPVRKDDSWRSFHEVMTLAKDRDVDMVLLAGDLFHDNKPSRKALYQVMRSLRLNCLGEKPCELEMLSDAGEVFEGAFAHVNYEDQDINVAIPVFSIHGNHDDPSGDGRFCSLDLLQVSGLLNYIGRTPESDNIAVKPVLLQKGQTKLALYGMSNVRDERLFRTFRDGKVKFFKPDVQQSDWYNIMAVHQNHHAHSETNYLPENFLPEFMDLIVWGHEHECLIEPRLNPETTFRVMQPGSSIATSLVQGEAVPKHVSIVSITGREMKAEPIRLKTVRPFITKEITLATHPLFKKLDKQKDNRSEVTRLLSEIIEGMIEEANADWLETQGIDDNEEVEIPLPLIRLKVEYTSHEENGSFQCENPQRFSHRFADKVANQNDVIVFHRKKKGTAGSKVTAADLPEESALASLSIDNVKIEKLVQEFLDAQSLKILPQGPFHDAVTQYVDKDDNNAMKEFVSESLQGQVKQLLELERNDDDDEGELETAMETFRSQMEATYSANPSLTRTTGRSKRGGRQRPANYDSDLDGPWEEQAEEEEEEEETAILPSKRGKSQAARKDIEDDDSDDVFAITKTKAPAKRTTTKKAAASKKAPAKKVAPLKKPTTTGGKAKRAPTPSDDEDEDEDIVMLDSPPAKARPKRAATTRASAAVKAATGGRQTQLNFSQPAQSQSQSMFVSQRPSQAARELSDDVISSDDEEAFAPIPAKNVRKR